ncbi:MAG: large subunit ribosomal protein [Candidatus Sumerlaeota bacterium]|nr:large subunit ribosomal protein [Candidatus Sumerlaeota bacterium]
MAHKKGVGSSRNGRDSNGQRRGVKAHDNQLVTGGSIIVRQCGNKFWPGRNVGQGKDFTIFAKVPGHIKFETKGTGRKFVHIIPAEEFAANN